MDGQRKLKITSALGEHAYMHEPETSTATADIETSPSKLLEQSKHVIQPLSTDLEVAAPNVGRRGTQQVSTTPAANADVAAGTPPSALSAPPASAAQKSVYPEPRQHGTTTDSPKTAAYDDRPAPVIAAFVVTLGVVLLLVTGLMFLSQLAAYSGAGYFHLALTLNNVLGTIILGIEVLLAVGIIMRRETARQLYVYFSIASIVWAAYKAYGYFKASEQLFAGSDAASHALAQSSKKVLLVQLAWSCLLPVIILVCLTPRRVKGVFG
jgi:hypothetical protein